MNNTNNNSNSLPLPQELNLETPSKDASTYEQRINRIRDQMAKRETLLQKSQSRAHFAVGRIVLSDPVLRKLIAPHLGRHLDKMGSARKAVDDYDQTAAAIAQLKALRP